MQVNAKGQIIGDQGLRWCRYRGDRQWWWTRSYSGFRIQYDELDKRWRLYHSAIIAPLFYGSLKDCMRVAEIHSAVRGR